MRITIVAVVLSVRIVSTALGDSAEWREKLFSSAPAAWQEIDRLSQHLDTVVMDRRYRADGSLAVEIEWHTKFSDNKSVQLMNSSEPFRSRKKVVGGNGSYAFELQRTLDDQPWNVRFVGQELSAKQTAMLDDCREAGRIQLQVGTIELPTLWESPHFKVTSVDPVVEDGVTYVAVTFENSKSPQPSKNSWPVRGTFTLAPDRLWAVKSYNVDVEYADKRRPPNQWTAVLEFQPSADGLPLMRKWERSQTGKAYEGQKWVWDYERYAPAEFPDEDFTLSAFGLPEIQSPSLWASSRLWLYLLAAGVVCVVIGIALRTRSRHAAAR